MIPLREANPRIIIEGGSTSDKASPGGCCESATAKRRRLSRYLHPGGKTDGHPHPPPLPGVYSPPPATVHFAAAVTRPPMATRKLTPVEVLLRLQDRLEKRMEAIQRAKLDGYEIVISELETEMDYLRRAARYLEK
jgi:hypothetical protein